MKVKKIIIFQISDDGAYVDLDIKKNKLYRDVGIYKLFLRYKIDEQLWDIKGIIKNDLFFSTSQVGGKTYLFNVDKDLRFINVFNRANVINWGIQRAIFDERIFIRNEMLRGDAIYNSLFRFRDINLSNVNDIYFAISIAVITTTLFKALIALFIFELVIIIVFDVDITAVIVIVTLVIVSEKSVFKLIAFDLDIKNCLAMGASFDKS